jgi:Fur family ferric uptake transcriptional regulator
MKRNTAQRDAIKEVFLACDGPLRIEDILRQGRRMVESLNLATVYRNLKILLEAGWIRTVAHPRLGTFYEIAAEAHHHHFHCRQCDRLFKVEGCALDEQRQAPDGFVTEGHEVFLFGLCPSCGRRGCQQDLLTAQEG